MEPISSVPGRTFFPNLSNVITFAVAPFVLTPFVRNQHKKVPHFRLPASGPLIIVML